MLVSLFQPHRLDGQNLMAPFVPFAPLGRHKGHGGEFPGKRCLLPFQSKRQDHIACIFPAGKGVHAPALHAQFADVNIPIHDLAAKGLILGKDGPVFRNHIMAPKDQVLGGLPFPAAAVNIPCQEPGTGRLYQHFPVSVLSHRLVRSRQIHQQRRPRHGMGNPRAIGHPDILTDLTPHQKPLHCLCP